MGFLEIGHFEKFLRPKEEGPFLEVRYLGLSHSWAYVYCNAMVLELDRGSS